MAAPHTVLMIGIEPNAVDYSDPALPPGLNADKIKAGLVAVEERFAQRGDRMVQCMLALDGSAETTLETQLASGTYDCVVIGAGLRKPEPNLKLFERVLNLVHRHAPHAGVAFNTTPQDSVEAVDRCLSIRD